MCTVLVPGWVEQLFKLKGNATGTRGGGKPGSNRSGSGTSAAAATQVFGRLLFALQFEPLVIQAECFDG